MPNHPLMNTDFEKWIGTNFAKYLLPIIPAGSALSEDSKLDDEHLGKTPGNWQGLYTGKNEWSGFFRWSTYYQQITVTAIKRWHAWQKPDQAGVPVASALNSIVLIGFDGDSDDENVIRWMRMCMESVLGPTRMVRRRDGAVRFLAVYRRDEHTAPFSKMRFVGQDKDGNKHLFEILGEGCQYVMEGPHAKGSMHYWENEEPVHTLWDELPVINHVQASTVKRRLEETCGMVGLERVSALSVTTSSDRASAVKITDVTSEHIEPNEERLLKAIEHIDLDHPEIDYNSFITLQRAICAAVMGDTSFINKIWPWICTQGPARGNGPRTEEQGQEWLETKWNSFPDSIVGARHVYWWAAKCGYTEAMEDANGEKAQEMFDALPDNPTDAQGADGSAGGAQGAGGAGGPRGTGSNGPLPQADNHDEIGAFLTPILRAEWRYNTNSRQWLHHVHGRWVGGYSVVIPVQEYCSALARTILATVNGPIGIARANRLKSYGTWMAVVKFLECQQSLRVDESSFDRDLWLLNTPGGYVDLRTCELRPHEPDLLMRRMTAVTPDMNALRACALGLQRWETVLPLYWMTSLNIARGQTPKDAVELLPVREGYMDAQGRWFGYGSQGNVHHQALMFVQGIPGIGKTQIYEAVTALLGSYGHGLTDNFINKTDDGKRFDTMQLIGIRFAFMDETRAGATFDDTRLSKVAASEKLTGEIKGGRVGIEFTNTTKISIVGNHRPHIQNGLTGGLTSRMLLFEAGGRNYRSRPGMQANLGRRIVAEEGPQLLAYIIWQARLDYIDVTTNNSADWERLMKPLHEAAETYTQESSFIHEWAEARFMAEDAGLEMLTMKAHRIVRGICQGARRAVGPAYEAARVQGHAEGGVQVDPVRQEHQAPYREQGYYRRVRSARRRL